MDISKLKRNPNAVKESFKQTGTTVVAVKECSILVPMQWEERNLLVKGDTVSLVGIYPIISGNVYGISNAMTMIETDPSRIDVVDINDIPHYHMQYEIGDAIISNTSVVKDDGIPYSVFDTFIDKGRIPWFLEYEDVGKLFDTSKPMAGVSFNIDHVVFEMLAATISRSPKDRTKFYRHIPPSVTGRPDFIPMRTVQYGASNTTAKLIGAHWSEGLMSSLVHPSERKELIEDLLRT